MVHALSLRAAREWSPSPDLQPRRATEVFRQRDLDYSPALAMATRQCTHSRQAWASAPHCPTKLKESWAVGHMEQCGAVGSAATSEATLS
jgi:hypothetical protein